MIDFPPVPGANRGVVPALKSSRGHAVLHRVSLMSIISRTLPKVIAPGTEKDCFKHPRAWHTPKSSTPPEVNARGPDFFCRPRHWHKPKSRTSPEVIAPLPEMDYFGYARTWHKLRRLVWLWSGSDLRHVVRTRAGIWHLVKGKESFAQGYGILVQVEGAHMHSLRGSIVPHGVPGATPIQ